MAITDKEKGVWGLDQVYNKINQGSIWEYSGASQLWAWGQTNDYGALGQNNRTNYNSPVQVGSLSTWSTLGGGNASAFEIYGSINTSGELFVWGRNNDGQLAQNDTVSRSSPVQIPGTTWAHVQIRHNDGMMAAKTDGTLWTWGFNEDGGFGIPSYSNDVKISSPVQIPGTTWSTNPNHYATGSAGRCWAIKTDGTLWAWGRDNYGRLGLNRPSPTSSILYSSPVQITTETNWTYVASAPGNTSVINTSGELFVWGDNYYAELGLNTQGSYVSSPTQIPGSTWSKSSLGQTSSYAIKTDGTLWAWGENQNGGQLGQNNRTDYSSPVQIPGTTWNILSRGGNSQMHAIKTDGTMWAWGYNNGQLGLGDNNFRSSPTQVPGTWSDLRASNDSTWAMKVL